MVQSAVESVWKMLHDPTAPPAVDLNTGALPPLGLLNVVAKMRLGLDGSTARFGSDCCAVSALFTCGIMSMMWICWAWAAPARPAVATRARALEHRERGVNCIGFLLSQRAGAREHGLKSRPEYTESPHRQWP